MQKENYELNLLANISKTLIENTSPIDILTILERFFNKFGRLSNKFVELKKINIYIYDENTKTLRDFSKSWIVLEQPNTNSYNDRLYLIITQLTQFSFFVNGKPYKIEEITDYGAITSKSEGENSIIIPLKQNNRPFGMVELIFPNNITNLLDPDFFMMLSIASYQISLKIQNTILTDQMQKNINFHKSMRDIAKIIESQYELNYIIPIIGEMIDRFVTEHLVYIFLRNEETDSFELVWPSACRDRRIYTVVKSLNAKSKYILTDEGRIGIFPLVGEKSLLGCVVAHSTMDKLSQKEIDYIEQLTKQSSITIHRANVYAEVLQHATLDALTGLNNRRQFETRLNQEVASAKRQEKPLCAIMMDIDFFKKVNDTYGHVAGDHVLKTVSGVIKKALRESDIPSRYGGEEFAILLPFTKIDEAFAVAQRLRQAVEKTPVDVPDEKGDTAVTIKVTISLGVYEYTEGDTPQELYQNADKALYQAKANGRNRVYIFKHSDNLPDIMPEH